MAEITLFRKSLPRKQKHFPSRMLHILVANLLHGRGRGHLKATAPLRKLSYMEVGRWSN